MGVRGDLRLLETAVRRRWNIDTEAAAKTINDHLSDADPRVALRAAGIAAVMESQNQKDEHKELDEFSNRVIELAKRLGIDVGAFGVGQTIESGTDASDATTTEAEKD